MRTGKAAFTASKSGMARAGAWFSEVVLGTMVGAVGFVIGGAYGLLADLAQLIRSAFSRSGSSQGVMPEDESQSLAAFTARATAARSAKGPQAGANSSTGTGDSVSSDAASTTIEAPTVDSERAPEQVAAAAIEPFSPSVPLSAAAKAAAMRAAVVTSMRIDEMRAAKRAAEGVHARVSSDAYKNFDSARQAVSAAISCLAESQHKLKEHETEFNGREIKTKVGRTYIDQNLIPALKAAETLYTTACVQFTKARAVALGSLGNQQCVLSEQDQAFDPAIALQLLTLQPA